MSRSAPCARSRAAEVIAVETAEHHVEQHQVEPLLPDTVERHTPVAHIVNLEAGESKMQREFPGSPRVFDDERAEARSGGESVIRHSGAVAAGSGLAGC